MKTLRIIFSYALTLLLYGVIIPGIGIKCGTYLDKVLGFPPLQFLGFHTPIGLAIMLLGLFFIFWSFYSIRTIGKGHPHEIFNVELAPRTSRLIIQGPYKYTRNPMCLGFTTLISGLGIFVGSLSTAVFSAVTYLVLGSLYLKFVEEKGLIERFGDDYLRYKEEIPMIIPMIKFKGPRTETKIRPKRFGLVVPKFRVSEKEKGYETQ